MFPNFLPIAHFHPPPLPSPWPLPLYCLCQLAMYVCSLTTVFTFFLPVPTNLSQNPTVSDGWWLNEWNPFNCHNKYMRKVFILLIRSNCRNKMLQMGGLNYRDLFFLMLLEAGSSRSGWQQGCVLMWVLVLSCRWPSFLCFSHGMECERASSLVSPLIRPQILLDQIPTLMISFNLLYFDKGPISRNSHTERASAHRFWGTHIFCL